MAKQAKIAAIANPNAGKHTPRAGLGTVIAKIMAAPRYTFATQTLDALQGAAASIHAVRPDIVAFSGGDGTLNATLNALGREYGKTPGAPFPKILLFPTGTENVVASSLRLTGSPEMLVENARAIREKLDAGAPLGTAHLHTLGINDRLGFLYGAGVPVHILRSVYAHAALGPKRRVFKTVTDALWKELCASATFRKSPQVLTKPVHAKLSYPQGSDPPYCPLMTHSAIIAGTVDEIGMGFRGLPDARKHHGRFMVRSTGLGFWGLLRSAGHLLTGISHPSIHDAVPTHVDIEYAEPTTITIDGEILEGRTHDRLICGPLVTFITG